MNTEHRIEIQVNEYYVKNVIKLLESQKCKLNWSNFSPIILAFKEILPNICENKLKWINSFTYGGSIN